MPWQNIGVGRLIEWPNELDETLLRLVKNEGAFDPLQSASNLMGQFLDAPDAKTQDMIINALWHCSEKIAKDIGLTHSLYSLLEINAVASIAQAAKLSDTYAQYCFGLFHYGKKKEANILLASDSYAVIAILCKNRINPYREIDATVVEMAAQLYTAMHLSREERWS